MPWLPNHGVALTPGLLPEGEGEIGSGGNVRYAGRTFQGYGATPCKTPVMDLRYAVLV